MENSADHRFCSFEVIAPHLFVRKLHYYLHIGSTQSCLLYCSHPCSTCSLQGSLSHRFRFPTSRESPSWAARLSQASYSVVPPFFASCPCRVKERLIFLHRRRHGQLPRGPSGNRRPLDALSCAGRRRTPPAWLGESRLYTYAVANLGSALSCRRETP